jgi:hypothetical protein
MAVDLKNLLNYNRAGRAINPVASSEENLGVARSGETVANLTPEDLKDENKRLAAEKKAADEASFVARRNDLLYVNPTYDVSAQKMAPYTQQYQDLASQAANRQAAQINYGRTGDVANALGLLNYAAQGGGPSAAEQPLRHGRDMAIQNAMSLGASARGGAANQVAAQRMALGQQGAAMNAYAGQAAQLRAQEMAQARGQFAGAAQAEQASRDQAALANLQAIGQQRALNSQEQLQYQQLKQGLISQQMNQAQAASGLYSQRELAMMQDATTNRLQNAQLAFQQQQANSSMWGGIGAGIGGAVGALPGIFTLNPALAVGGAGVGSNVGSAIAKKAAS